MQGGGRTLKRLQQRRPRRRDCRRRPRKHRGKQASLFLWQFSPWHTDRSLHYTPIHASISQRLGGELPAPLHHEGTQPPRVHGLHYGFLPSLELERVLPIRLNGKTGKAPREAVLPKKVHLVSRSVVWKKWPIAQRLHRMGMAATENWSRSRGDLAADGGNTVGKAPHGKLLLGGTWPQGDMLLRLPGAQFSEPNHSGSVPLAHTTAMQRHGVGVQSVRGYTHRCSGVTPCE